MLALGIIAGTILLEIGLVAIAVKSGVTLTSRKTKFKINR